MALILQIFKVSVIHFLLTRHLYNKRAINSAMSSYSFFPFFPSHEGGKVGCPNSLEQKPFFVLLKEELLQEWSSEL